MPVGAISMFASLESWELRPHKPAWIARGARDERDARAGPGVGVHEPGRGMTRQRKTSVTHVSCLCQTRRSPLVVVCRRRRTNPAEWKCCRTAEKEEKGTKLPDQPYLVIYFVEHATLERRRAAAS